MTTNHDYFNPYCLFCIQNAFFLILPNVKIPSPLTRVKIDRTELFSENGDSTRIL